MAENVRSGRVEDVHMTTVAYIIYWPGQDEPSVPLVGELEFGNRKQFEAALRDLWRPVRWGSRPLPGLEIRVREGAYGADVAVCLTGHCEEADHLVLVTFRSAERARLLEVLRP